MSFNEKMAFFNQNNPHHHHQMHPQMFNYRAPPFPYPTVPHPSQFYPNFPHGTPYPNFNPAFFNNYREIPPNNSFPQNVSSFHQKTTPKRKNNTTKTPSQQQHQVKVKREAVVKNEMPVQKAPVPVPFVFTDQERSDCIKNLKQEAFDIYDLFEDIPNTGQTKHCYKKPKNKNIIKISFF